MKSKDPPVPSSAADTQLEAILEKIRESRNFDFRDYKRATLVRRVERRMLDRRCRSLRQYAELLDHDPDEVGALSATMLIKVTIFFRDGRAWETSGREVLPQLLQRKRE